MVDDHGIEFNVIAENEKVTIAEAYIPFLYSKNLFYTTDYKERIMAYYTGEIEDILKEAGIADYIFQKNWIEINITEDYSLEDLATVIIALDDLLDYGYRNNTISRDSLGKNQYWDCIDWYDILIKQRGSDNKQLLYETFLFSDNNRIAFTHENVLKTLELSQMLMTSDAKLNIIRINGELYYDSGVISQDEKTGEMKWMVPLIRIPTRCQKQTTRPTSDPATSIISLHLMERSMSFCQTVVMFSLSIKSSKDRNVDPGSAVRSPFIHWFKYMSS